MSTATENNDTALLDLLRRSGPMGVAELAEEYDVTAGAVRQRLSRLMADGLVERSTLRNGRGRPSHQYHATEKARRQASNNFADLAMVLWNELRTISSAEVRRGLMNRLASAMADMYRGRVHGATLKERMTALRDVLAERGVQFEVREYDGLPILNAVDCPYPELAAEDRGVCAIEKMAFSELLGDNVRLSHCRFDGGDCCRFQTN